ncbi:hypothetical protein EPA93_38805 [Ktedonosporobacter rubrisoli]|uniref:Uncharacterized protein n=1 Tax=Ktedonosporobacter rubrisoli TaxID=2509675 RepID=A0A4P6K0E8_KTERU|nr:hypothetical protein [Ktedonosporobacter rubrisoli]QBD81607.1 hypothetical protein EPA93_38805 [Ktedonosporobacter rubrisoli]
MGEQVLSQQDCFIYISSLQEKMLAPVQIEQARSMREELNSPLAYDSRDSWVRIPLEGKVIVYAHLWD